MENNTNLISDTELRKLLNQFILMDVPHNDLQMQIIDMEATINMNTLPVSLAGTALQETLLRKFRYKLLKKALFKGLIVSTTAAATSGAAWLALKKTTSVSTNKALPTVIKSDAKNALPAVPFEAAAKNNLLFTDEPPPFSSSNPNLFLSGRSFSSLPESGSLLPIQSYVPLLKNPLGWNPSPLHNSSNSDSVLQFGNIKKIVLKTAYCNLNIKGITGGNQTKIAYKLGGSAEGNKKFKQKISWQVEGEQLVLTIEPEKKRTHISFNFKETYQAMLSIEIPAIELLTINNHSGNISGTNIQSKQFVIQNEYGNCVFENTEAETEVIQHSGNVAINRIKGNLKLAVEYGNASLSDAEGNVQATLHSGHFAGQNIIGGCNLKTEYGNVSLNTLKGNLCNVEIHNGHCSGSLLQFDKAVFNLEYGNLSLGNITSAITASLHNGNTSLENIIGETTITSEYGQQSLRNIKGNLNLKLSTGNATCQFINGNVNIKGTYSNISLSTLNGDLAISTETGSISGNAITLKNSAILKTEHGNILLQTTNDIESLSYNLNSESGKVSVSKNATNISKQNGGLVVNKGSININANTETGNILLQ